jgi:hypothetical protein
MRAGTRNLFFSLASAILAVTPVVGSPLNSKLLRLVPPDAQIVAGFENHADVHRHGQLVLATRNNRLDLDDWQAIAGVDHRRVFEEVIEVAATLPGGGMLTEHMVMVAGKFNKELIFRSLELNGSQKADFEGLTIMLIQPFAREKDQMRSERWLVILDNRVAIFGTAFLVQGAVHRYLAHADIDMPLMERLSQLRRDNTSWNVMLWSPRVLSNYKVAQSSSSWGRLLEGAEVLMVGARFGSKVRVEFLLHAPDRGREFFEEKAALFAEVFAPALSRDSDVPQRRRTENVSFDSDRVQGSIQLSLEQFEDWSHQTSHPHVYLVPRVVSRGE